MNGEQVWLMAAAGGAVALVLLLACALLWRNSRRLAARPADLEARTATREAGTEATATMERVESATYVITGLHDAEADVEAETVQAVPARIDGRLFADIVARESVVKAAGLAHGLRRALSAENRNRIRFEMKREVKRSRKQRRAHLKAAMRQIREDAA
ncbi:hypothetical protein [Nocardioides sp. B-3]|uniref:hypothetical protein n=1 Tax=Nocardioides sp. B-3 TaxID=2895565 RepID=UPI0021529073|nr:hypothetical protein [Nocardioides sp. B-3]UUZ59358.1 hypothetical protein LP418_26560 [Nocardioides sp. B-3]